MGKNETQVFTFDNAQFGSVRIIEEDEKYLFCGSDVTKALGYANTSKALTDHCRYLTKRYTPHPQSSNKQIEMTFIPEGDVYRLIVHSKLPSAERFESWVFDEVLPTIRKHGAYVADSVLNQLDENPELVSDFIHQLKEENAEARKNRELLEQARAENAKLTPKAGYYDHFVSPESLTNIRYTAKELGVPQNKFIGYLLEKNYAYRDRHRKGRIFAKAGKRNDSLFMTKDFYLPNGTKSEYTLVTPAGKAYFHARVEKILAWEPGDDIGEEITEEAVFAE